MIRAILWKEWKKTKALFTGFLFASIIIPATVTLSSNHAQDVVARGLMSLFWMLFALDAGYLLYEEKRHDTLRFLNARPAAAPPLFAAHYLSHLIMLLALASLSYFVYCLFGALTGSDMSFLDVALNPFILTDVLGCIFVLSFALFVASSVITLGSRISGLGFLALLFLSVIFIKLMSLGDRFPPLAASDLPCIFLLGSICGVALWMTLSFWLVSFNMIRDTRNRAWMFALGTISLLCLFLLTWTTTTIAGLMKEQPKIGDIEEVQVTGIKEYPVAILVSNNPGRHSILLIESFFPNALSNVVKEIHIGGGFQPASSDAGRTPMAFVPTNKKLVHFLHRPLWGEETRSVDLMKDKINTVSPMRYSRREFFSFPFSSPDGDRIAYLRRNGAKAGERLAQSLFITKFSPFLVSDRVKLTESGDITFEPVGWTPDGYDFLLRRSENGKREIWAVDWNATGARKFLPEFSMAAIGENDLPQAGEWISLVEHSGKAGSDYTLWLVNYRNNSKIQVCVSREIPTRSWSKTGKQFACWTGEGGLNIFEVEDSPQKQAASENLDQVFQLKWPPSGNMLAVVRRVSDAQGERDALDLYHPADYSLQHLIEDFSATEKQWDWLDDKSIVYASNNELWQAHIKGKQSLIISTVPFSGRVF